MNINVVFIHDTLRYMFFHSVCVSSVCEYSQELSHVCMYVGILQKNVMNARSVATVQSEELLKYSSSYLITTLPAIVPVLDLSGTAVASSSNGPIR